VIVVEYSKDIEQDIVGGIHPTFVRVVSGCLVFSRQNFLSVDGLPSYFSTLINFSQSML